MSKTLTRTETKAQKDQRVNLAKLQKVFKIIAMLKGGHWTAKQLAESLDVNISSIYRYIDLLEASGFYIEKDFHSRYFMVTTDDDPIQAQFSFEEMSMMRSLLQADANHPLKSSILKKLSLHSEMDSMPRIFLKAHLGHLVEQLTHAIRDKHQVILKNYHSANASEVRDRHVEPIHFGDNYGTIVALDLDDKTCKQFKLDRIGEIIETHKSCTHQHLHEQRTTDMFGLAGKASINIKLIVSLRAFLLLREEFPTAQAYLTTDNNTYVFHGPVANFAGIGRFVMGLLDEIEIVEPVEFRKYVGEKVGGFCGS